MKYPVSIAAEYDDVAGTITLTLTTPAPPPPPDVRPDLWYPTSARVAEISLPAKKLAAVPEAHYVIPDSNPVERRYLQYRGGAWVERQG